MTIPRYTGFFTVLPLFAGLRSLSLFLKQSGAAGPVIFQDIEDLVTINIWLVLQVPGEDNPFLYLLFRKYRPHRLLSLHRWITLADRTRSSESLLGVRDLAV